MLAFGCWNRESRSKIQGWSDFMMWSFSGYLSVTSFIWRLCYTLLDDLKNKNMSKVQSPRIFSSRCFCPELKGVLITMKSDAFLDVVLIFLKKDGVHLFLSNIILTTVH